MSGATHIASVVASANTIETITKDKRFATIWSLLIFLKIFANNHAIAETNYRFLYYAQQANMTLVQHADDL